MRSALPTVRNEAAISYFPSYILNSKNPSEYYDASLVAIEDHEYMLDPLHLSVVPAPDETQAQIAAHRNEVWFLSEGYLLRF